MEISTVVLSTPSSIFSFFFLFLITFPETLSRVKVGFHLSRGNGTTNTWNTVFHKRILREFYARTRKIFFESPARDAKTRLTRFQRERVYISRLSPSERIPPRDFQIDFTRFRGYDTRDTRMCCVSCHSANSISQFAFVHARELLTSSLPLSERIVINWCNVVA